MITIYWSIYFYIQLFSESAHSSESNQRPYIYANPQDISFNAIKLNADHVQVSSPNSDNTCNNVTMTNLLRMNPNAKHLNEMAHRHSFNESIYSEPYGGRYVAGNSKRLESNQLSESTSASNIYSGKVVTATRSHPPYSFHQNTLSHRDIYGTNSSFACNGLPADVSSTRSSVYSDRTILNEQTPPSTPHPLHGENEHTIKATNPKNSTASNASGSQANLQFKSFFTNTKQVQTLQSNSNTLNKSSLNTEGNGGDQSEKMIVSLLTKSISILNILFYFFRNCRV